MLRSGAAITRGDDFDSGGDIVADNVRDFNRFLARLITYSSDPTDPNYEKQLKVAPSRVPNSGNGVFAQVPFKEGDLITLYDGRVEKVDRPSRLRRARPAYVNSLLEGCFNVVGVDRPVFGRGLGSLINDPIDLSFFLARRFAVYHEGLSPNVSFVFVATEDAVRAIRDAGQRCPPDRYMKEMAIVIEAARDIEPGEELLVQYGIDYWNGLLRQQRADLLQPGDQQ